jgi:hypothetical protein
MFEDLNVWMFECLCQLIAGLDKFICDSPIVTSPFKEKEVEKQNFLIQKDGQPSRPS